MFDQPVAVIDFETTGLRPGKSRAIEAAVVTIEEGRIADVYSSLIKSVQHIPYEITQLTGIDRTMIEAAPSAAQVMEQVSSRITRRVIAAHNASFDISFLKSEFALCKINFCGSRSLEEPICTLQLARRLLPSLSRKRLSDVVSAYGISFSSNAHRAEADATATAKILLAMGNVLRERFQVESISIEQMRRIMSLRIRDADQTIERIFREAMPRRVYTNLGQAESQDRTSIGFDSDRHLMNDRREFRAQEGRDMEPLDNKLEILARRIRYLESQLEKERSITLKLYKELRKKDGSNALISRAVKPNTFRSCSPIGVRCKSCGEFIFGRAVDFPVIGQCPSCGSEIDDYFADSDLE